MRPCGSIGRCLFFEAQCHDRQAKRRVIYPSRSVTFWPRRSAPFLIATFWKKVQIAAGCHVVQRCRHVLYTLSSRCENQSRIMPHCRHVVPRCRHAV